ncbi:DUF4258 domain-containing protein [Candidatus Woesearchaeota archaeon]|nr:DUF4258 domain-containing protein [Candidatus Woesearchaeota archaeon]
MIISDHANKEMLHSGISEEEVQQCLKHGELEIRQVIKGETRYGKKLVLKDKTIIIIYTLRKDEERVITAYVIRRKKQW